jgi:uncharacterized protein
MNEHASARPPSAPDDPSEPGLTPTESTPAAAGSPLAPVGERERLLPVDAVRGLALLGIFAVNIWGFAYPFAAMMNPNHPALVPYAGEFGLLQRTAWLVQYLFFDMKLMAIFSMLFGAGLILMVDRAGSRGVSLRGIYYRRVLWLLAIGLLHAYFLWYGDILVLYALCGLILYPLRNWRPRTLILVSIPMLIIPVVMFLIMGGMMWWLRDVAMQADAAIAAGGTPTDFQLEMQKAWHEARAGFDPTPAQVAEQVAALRGSPLEVLRTNALLTFGMHLQMFPMWGIWRAGGLMLLGMALMKMNVLSGQRSTRFYMGMLAFGYGVGLPLVGIAAWDQLATDFEVIRAMMIGWNLNSIGSIFVALGHISALMLLYRGGILRGMLERLAAVGRLALTNYVAQTLISTFFFYGWGLGFFAALERQWLFVFVVSIWSLQLAWSPLWLRHFRYGPAEWLWRTLTYMQFQPLRR